MKTKLLFLLLLPLLCIDMHAQKKNAKIVITGTVTDNSQRPVPNAMLLIDGVKTGAVTNAEGEYRIKVGRNASTIGILSFGKGMLQQSLDGRTVVDFRYSNKAQTEGGQTADIGNEEVNTGYGNTKEKYLTTTVDKIDGKKKNYASYSSILEMIVREVAGARIANGAIVLQDSRDLFGSVPALFVVNGVPVTTTDNIHPSQVESIEVLKGSSAAIYGSRGYGGVILIKTKIQVD